MDSCVWKNVYLRVPFDVELRPNWIIICHIFSHLYGNISIWKVLWSVWDSWFETYVGTFMCLACFLTDQNSIEIIRGVHVLDEGPQMLLQAPPWVDTHLSRGENERAKM